MNGAPSSEHPISCSEVLRDMDLFLDCELAEDRLVQIRSHLAQCSNCLSEYGVEREVISLVARCCGGEHAPPHVRARIEEKLRGLVTEMNGREYRAE